jgi:hypothetical protein
MDYVTYDPLPESGILQAYYPASSFPGSNVAEFEYTNDGTEQLEGYADVFGYSADIFGMVTSGQITITYTCDCAPP